MGILEFLKKIGILHTWKGQGTYKNAKERPDSFVKQENYEGTESQAFNINDDSNNNEE